jgi:hypothetical protein
MKYIIEIQKLIRNKHNNVNKYIHYGYMNILFKNPTHCMEYFNQYNYCKLPLVDWTRNLSYNGNVLRYVMRDYHNEILTVDPFNMYDIPNKKILYFENGDIKHIGIKTYEPL